MEGALGYLRRRRRDQFARRGRMSPSNRLGSLTFGSVRAAVRRVLVAVGWLALIVVIGLGGGGHRQRDGPPAGHRRSAGADVASATREVNPMLDAAAADLSALADQVAALGIQARGALAALNGADTTTVDDGDRRRRRAGGRPAGADRGAPPGAGGGALRRHAGRGARAVGAASRRATRRSSAALDATEGLDDAWAAADPRLGRGDPDERPPGHARRPRGPGRRARPRGQVRRRDRRCSTRPTPRSSRPGALRDQLANTVDVTVLDQWLDRNAAYDVALRNLYKAISKVGSKVTDAVRAAIAAEQAAQATGCRRTPAAWS